MKKYEPGQKVWVPATIAETDHGTIMDLRLRFDDGDGGAECNWFSSKHSEILTEAPQQPKPPAPVKLFGHTIFDLENCVEIGDIWSNSYGDDDSIIDWKFRLTILRGHEKDDNFFAFKTKEEAEAARALVEKAVLKAKGIDDDQDA